MVIIEKLEVSRRRQVLAIWAILFLAHQFQLAESFGLSRNPLFGGFLNRRNAIPVATINSLHQHQQQFQHHYKRYQQQEAAGAATTNGFSNNNVDPYISGSNSAEKSTAESADQILTSSDPLSAQTSQTLAVAASSYSAAGAGSGGGYGGGSGGAGGSYGSSGGSGGGYGAGSAGSGGGYGGGSGGAGGSYGSSGGSGGGYGAGSAGSGGSYGDSGAGGGYGAGADGYGGSGGSGLGGSYGLGGGSGGSYGLGGAGGQGGPSYSVAYPAQGNTKADTIHLLSSLAPSLLLSSLLLPLALALLTNATGALTGRKKRDLFSLPDDDEDSQFFLEEDTLDDDITSLDAHFFPTMDSMLESYSPDNIEKLTTFVNHRGLSDPLNPCLEKLACLAATTKSKFKRSDKLKKAIQLLEKTTDPDIKKRLKEGASIGEIKERNCLTKLICKSSSASVS